MLGQEKVQQLAELVGWTGHASAPEPRRVRESFGMTLPDDYHAYLQRFPAGEFQTFISVPVPTNDSTHIPQDLVDLVDAMNRSKTRATQFPYAIFPQRSGVLPWGYCGVDWAFCWLTVGHPNDWPTIVCDWSLDPWHRYEGGMTHFLIDAIHGQTGIPDIGYFSREEPSFDAWML